MSTQDGHRPTTDEESSRKDTRFESESRFRAVFEGHYRDLWHYARELGVPVSERDDLIQDVFLRVYEHRETLVVSNALTYTYSVLRNAWYSKTRRRTAKKRGGEGRIDPEVDPDEQPSPGRSSEESQIGRERSEALVEAMRALPPKMRRCAVLRYGRGLSTAEIAERLGITEATVRSHLHHGARRLKAILGSGQEP